ncbi:MAG: SufE family protein [Isosphaeraceae bacterium]
MTSALEEIVTEFQESDVEEKKELLIDFAKKLPPLPERFEALKDEAHRVHECQSPVFLFVEVNGGQVRLFADAPIEAPTVRGFVSLLVEGLNGAKVHEVADLKFDLIRRLGLVDVLGMLRLNGLQGVLHRVKAEVIKASALADLASQKTPS